MRKLLVFVLALAGCVSVNSHPAQVGMSYDEYDNSCPYGSPPVFARGEELFGECPTKPGEYVVIKDGVIVRVLDTQQYANEAAARACQSGDRACEATVYEKVFEYTRQQKLWLNQAVANENRTRGAALQQLGNSISAATAPPQTQTPPSGLVPNRTFQVCFKRGEYAEGLNKICSYDCLGSPAAITIGSSELCPLQIER